MELVINDKTYEMYFGLDFIEYLDQAYPLKQNGVEIYGMGVVQAASYLQMRNPRVLLNLIKAGTTTDKKKIGVAEIKKWIETQEDLKPLYDDFLSALETASVTKDAMKMAKAQAN